jgi:hypothetical protein
MAWVSTDKGDRPARATVKPADTIASRAKGGMRLASPVRHGFCPTILHSHFQFWDFESQEELGRPALSENLLEIDLFGSA